MQLPQLHHGEFIAVKAEQGFYLAVVLGPGPNGEVTVRWLCRQGQHGDPLRGLHYRFLDATARIHPNSVLCHDLKLTQDPITKGLL